MPRLLAFALTLASVAWAQTPQQPLTFWRYGMPDQMALQQAMDCAIGRWRVATCLPIDVSYSPAHWIRFALPQDLPANANANSSGATWNSIRIKLSTSLDEHELCPMLVHEMGHVLRRNMGHTDEDGSMGFAVTHINTEPVSKITAGDLVKVCTQQPCGCMVPE